MKKINLSKGFIQRVVVSAFAAKVFPGTNGAQDNTVVSGVAHMYVSPIKKVRLGYITMPNDVLDEADYDTAEVTIAENAQCGNYTTTVMASASNPGQFYKKCTNVVELLNDLGAIDKSFADGTVAATNVVVSERAEAEGETLEVGETK